MILKVSKFSIFIIISHLAFSQENNSKGYWDEARTFKQSFNLQAGEKRIMSVELPIGTTELVYRITVTDVGKGVSNSLVSILNKIPSGTSAIYTSGINILSNISGNSQCYYSVFNSGSEATKFIKYGIEKSIPCYKSNLKINQDYKILNANSNCLKNKLILYFGFKSTNMIESETVTLEVVPWIDKKQATGWNIDTKKEFLSKCKRGYNDLPQNDKFCMCILDKLIGNYTVDEYNRLLAEERIKFIENNEAGCKENSGVNDEIIEKTQEQADDFFEKGDYKNAISKYLELVDNNTANTTDYQYLSESYLLTKQFTKALKYIKIAEQMDESDLSIKLDLAHSLLLTESIEEAKKIYSKYKNENIDEETSWKKGIQEDFKLFTENDIKSDYFNVILNSLK